MEGEDMKTTKRLILATVLLSSVVVPIFAYDTSVVRENNRIAGIWHVEKDDDGNVVDFRLVNNFDGMFPVLMMHFSHDNRPTYVMNDKNGNIIGFVAKNEDGSFVGKDDSIPIPYPSEMRINKSKILGKVIFSFSSVLFLIFYLLILLIISFFLTKLLVQKNIFK